MNGSGGPHGEHLECVAWQPAPRATAASPSSMTGSASPVGVCRLGAAQRQADVQFFTEPFASEDEAATALAGFDIILGAP